VTDSTDSTDSTEPSGAETAAGAPAGDDDGVGPTAEAGSVTDSESEGPDTTGGTDAVRTGDRNDTDGGTEADDPAIDLAAALEDGPVLFFDGVCNLCNGVVQFVIERDDDERIRFASLQSEVGRAVRERLDLSEEDLETVVLVEGSKAYTKSAAAIRVGELLGGVYGLARVGWLVPRPVRNWLYDVVAEHRYDWFGRKDQCMVPTPERQSRFVE
jgi:predicted DCC family thiol-disulfide oxidoreductase YuxK